MGCRCEKYSKLVNGVKSNVESETKRDVAERTLKERGRQEMACVTRWNGRDIVRRIAGRE